jgi:hypothetical protein
MAGFVLPDEFCRECQGGVGVDGAALTAISRHGDRAMLASSDELSARVEEIELTLGEGPSVDAFVAHRPVSAVDLSSAASARRWPGFAGAAIEVGVGAAFAFPLLVGASCIGTLQLCRRLSGPLSTSQFRDAFRYAETGLWAVLDARAGIPATGLDGTYLPLAGGQDEVFQASGMISVQLGVGVDEALVRLRAYAFSHDRPLHDVAHDVVVRRFRFNVADSAAGT